MVKTRKSLWAAGFALLVCILLLIGTTFAWFTDSVTNSGNRIQAAEYYLDGEKIGSVDLIFSQDCREAGYTDCLKKVWDIFL